MKKAVLVILVLTVVGAMVFAEDTVNWRWNARIKTGAQITLGDSTSVPTAQIIANDADDPKISRIRLQVGADVGNYSLDIKINTDLNTAGGAADAFRASNWWVTANFLEKMVQVRFGSIDNGVSGTQNNGWGGLSLTGGQLVVAPISGLSVGVAMPVTATGGSVDAALAGIAAGFEYAMPDLVTVDATYMNVGGTNMSNAAFGFDVKAVPNLTAQFEGNLTQFGGTTAATTYEFFENVAYAMGPLTPGLTVDETLYGNSGSNVQIWIKPNVDYAIMDGTNVGASVKYTMNSAGGTTSGLVVDPYVKFTFNSKAKLKIDAAYTIPNLSATSTWTLPININFMWVF